MSFESQSFRRETAKQLKSMDKSSRLEFLAGLKLSPEYLYAHATHGFEVSSVIMQERIRKIAAHSETLEELKQRLGAEELLIANDVFGIDHSEHIVKQIELAEATGCVLPVVEYGGLAKTVEDMLLATGHERVGVVDPNLYQAYLNNRLPDLDFSDEDWQAVIQKLPADTFTSIDVAMERLTLLLNTVAETETRFSCGGHAERSNRIAKPEGYFSHAYMAFITMDEDLIVDFRKEFEGSPTVDLEIDDYSPGTEKVILRFQQVPSEEWLIQNKKRSRAHIRTDCREALEKKFGISIPGDISERDYSEKLFEVQTEYAKKYPEITLHHEPNSRLFREMQIYDPDRQQTIEYADYNKSGMAKSVRDDFLHRAEEVVKRYKVDHKN